MLPREIDEKLNDLDAPSLIATILDTRHLHHVTVLTQST